MADFLAPILRTQFNLFYRFGYIFIPNCYLVEFDGEINEKVSDKIEEIFTFLTPFEYDEEYVILHLSKEPTRNFDISKFKLLDVIAIYPLSKQAKKSIEAKIDVRIKLSEPVFESNIVAVEDVINSNEKENAIEALWTISDISESPESVMSLIDMQAIEEGIKYRQFGAKASEIQSASYYSFLLAYDRYDHFPNSTLGYFFDAGQVFAYSKGLSTFEGSGLYKILSQLDPQIRFSNILKSLQENEIAQSYLNQTTQDNGVKNFLVAPLFFMLRDELRSLDSMYQSKLLKFPDEFKKYGIEFKIAVILLGSFFGYKKFYDVYYDKIKPPFFKRTSAIPNGDMSALQGIEKPFVISQMVENLNQESNLKGKKTPADKSQVCDFIKSFIKPGEDYKIAVLSSELKKKFTKVPNNEIIKNIITNEIPYLQIIKNTVSYKQIN